jgi:cell division protein FtsW
MARISLLFFTVFLLTVGVVMQYSCDIGLDLSFQELTLSSLLHSNPSRQVLWIVMGGIAALVVSRLDYEKTIVQFAPVFYLVSVALLLYLAFASVTKMQHHLPFIGDTKGGYRWLELPGPLRMLKVQPSEFAKLATTICICMFFARNQALLAPEKPFPLARALWSRYVVATLGDDAWRKERLRIWNEYWVGLILPGLIMAVPCVLILLGRSLSMTILTFMQSYLLSMCAGVRRFYLIVAAVTIAYLTWCGYDYGNNCPIVRRDGSVYQHKTSEGKPILVSSLNCIQYNPAFTPERLERLTSWCHPEEVQQEGGMQLWYSQLALGSGGFNGVGLGNSRLKRDYLPEKHNDFVISVLGEEFGFIGVCMVLFFYAGLVGSAFWIAVLARRNQLLMLSAMGFGLLIGCHAFINIGVASGFLPTTGITAPFLSYGGSSMIVSLVTIGLLLSVSTTAERQELRESSCREDDAP